MRYMFIDVTANKVVKVNADDLDDAWHAYIYHFYPERLHGFGSFERAKEMLEHDIFVTDEETVREI